MGLIGTAYNLPLNDLRWEKIDFGVACAYWRSVGNSQNVHFLEHSLEKAARLAKMDSIDYRLRLLQTSPRAASSSESFGDKQNGMRPCRGLISQLRHE